MAIGNLLRQARETRLLTTKDVEEATKIRRKYLEALENEQFHFLPDRSYVRCFLGTYSRFLRLDTSDLLKEFSQIYPPEMENEIQKETTKHQKPNHRVASHHRMSTAHARLTAGRDVQILTRMRETLSEKKQLPLWKQLLKRF